jgi:hypothetical protein
MTPDVWDIFHDGDIVKISGSVPGQIELTIHIKYLRAMFGGVGESFRMVLSDCSQFELEAYDESTIFNLSEIEEHEPEILSVGEDGPPLVIHCSTGTLRVMYKEERVVLDTGEPVSFEELTAGCARYWKEWSDRSRGRS